MMTKEEKLAKAAEARASIQKDHGKGAIMNLSESANMDIQVIPTGSIGLDVALGVGGWPRGRFVELYGQESSGKTTIAIHAMAECQKAGGLCAIIDAEHAFDKEYAASLGVNVEELDISQPDNGEQGLEIADKLLLSGAYDLIVIDSIAALVPKAELEGEMGENKMGLHARLMGQACRKMTGNAKRSNTTVIWINQIREKIGVMFGNPETTPGGNAMKFYASIRAIVSRSTTKDNSTFEDGNVSGNLTKINIIKNKVAPPFRKTEFNILFGVGIDKIGEAIDIASELKLIKKWGNQITIYGEQETKMTLTEFTELLKNNPEFYTELETKIKSMLHG